jgi:hypothetical protein
MVGMANLPTGLSETPSAPCVSIANLGDPESEPGQPELLLAGYRNGLLIMKTYKTTTNGSFHVLKEFQHHIGSTAVTFKLDPLAPNVALICCDFQLWRMTFDCRSHSDPVMHRVWFTNADNVSIPSCVKANQVQVIVEFVIVTISPDFRTPTSNRSRLDSARRLTHLIWEAASDDITGSCS